MVEVYFCQTLWAFDGNCYITVIIITPILASYFLNKDNVLSFNTKILSELSIYIFLHPIIIYVLKNIIFISNDMLFILTSISTIIVAYVFLKMKNISAVKKIFSYFLSIIIFSIYFYNFLDYLRFV